MTRRGQEWQAFSDKVAEHINNYTVPQYGDKGEDAATDYTAEYCMSQVEKYARRFGRNARGPAEQQRDFVKMAHYICLAETKHNDAINNAE